MTAKLSVLRTILLSPIRVFALLVLFLVAIPLLLTGSRYFQDSSGLVPEPSKQGWLIVVTFYLVVVTVFGAIWFYLRQ